VILSRPSVRAWYDQSWGGMTASGPHSPVADGGALGDALPVTLGEMVAGIGVARATGEGAGEAQPAATPMISTPVPSTAKA
jgi:hypothetical protein